MYRRNCPKCNKELFYASPYSCRNAEQKQSVCFSCSNSIYPRCKEIPIADKFWRRVEKTDGCWIFHSSKANGGYGRLGKKGMNKCLRAHRISWEIHNGPIPEGMNVCHKCDNPPCVRPDHLFLGTDSDNMADKINKHRCGPCGNKGIKHPLHKLTEEQVREIKYSINNQRECALKYGVNQRTISAIRCGVSWKHITTPKVQSGTSPSPA